VTDERTVLFVCLHGAGMSRMAAAYFLSVAPAGWHAVSAGIEPGDVLSTTAETLLADTVAEEFLDHSPPRSIDAVREPWRVIALRNPEIQYELASDERWDLTSSAGRPLRDEIRDRAEALARSISAPERAAS
jgi:arsenate reductase (thioredoxin)